eukprot:CAMPEP_0171154098 /NCGR_PEP_ID=MMETSP0790-20130122/109_1 /TAXON_ID=2925 /ORGANISM="Alexandrium catenella, Strain OF101" /LENGTH=48 /DNA_ID= /DNA_START= /DNA_END= /DNA_ORIENTATION=
MSSRGNAVIVNLQQKCHHAQAQASVRLGHRMGSTSKSAEDSSAAPKML